jgi:peptidoglycan/xylan/chitin deacetylase (PgdA/CDA1 family)
VSATKPGKREAIARLSANLGLTSALEILPGSRRLVILNYHRIGDPAQTPYDPTTFSTSAEEFDQQIGWLKRRFHIATLDETVAALDGAHRWAKSGTSLLITFDDGYLDNYTAAFPVLRSHGVQGIFFLPTAFVGSGRIPWWDSIAYIVKHTRNKHTRNRAFRLEYPESVQFDLDQVPLQSVLNRLFEFCRRNEVDTHRLIAGLEEACNCPRPAVDAGRCFLNWDEAREMQAAGMAFGSHTHTHEILAKLPPDRQREELETSFAIVQRELAPPVHALAYPVGLLSCFSADTIRIAQQAGYAAAFSYYGGANVPGHMERFDIRRFPIANPSVSRLRLQIALAGITGSYWY